MCTQVSNSSSPVLCLHVFRGALRHAPALNGYTSNKHSADAFTKKCHVPWTFTYTFMVYEYVSHREQPWEHHCYKGSWDVPRWHSRCRVQLWAHGYNVPVKKTHFILESIHLPPRVLAHTAGGDIPAAFKTFTVQSRDGKAENLRKWQPDPQKSWIIFLLSGQPFRHSLAAWHLQTKWQNRSYQTNNGVLFWGGQHHSRDTRWTSAHASLTT